jgi:hypothetical protein
MRALNTAWEGLGMVVLDTLPAETRMAIGFASFGKGGNSYSLAMYARHAAHHLTHASQREKSPLFFWAKPCLKTIPTLPKALKAFIHRCFAGKGCSKNCSQPFPKENKPC